MPVQRSLLQRRFVGWGIACVAAGAACRAAPPPADARILTGWVRAQYALGRAERLSPPLASRVVAYRAVGLYRGLAAGSPPPRSLAGPPHGLGAPAGPPPRRPA